MAELRSEQGNGLPLRGKGIYHSAEGAARAWGKAHGITGRSGGWLYSSAGERLVQGWGALSQELRAQGKILPLGGGRWRLADEQPAEQEQPAAPEQPAAGDVAPVAYVDLAPVLPVINSLLEQAAERGAARALAQHQAPGHAPQEGPQEQEQDDMEIEVVCSTCGNPAPCLRPKCLKQLFRPLGIVNREADPGKPALIKQVWRWQRNAVPGVRPLMCIRRLMPCIGAGELGEPVPMRLELAEVPGGFLVSVYQGSISLWDQDSSVTLVEALQAMVDYEEVLVSIDHHPPKATWTDGERHLCRPCWRAEGVRRTEGGSLPPRQRSEEHCSVCLAAARARVAAEPAPSAFEAAHKGAVIISAELVHEGGALRVRELLRTPAGIVAALWDERGGLVSMGPGALQEAGAAVHVRPPAVGFEVLCDAVQALGIPARAGVAAALLRSGTIRMEGGRFVVQEQPGA